MKKNRSPFKACYPLCFVMLLLAACGQEGDFTAGGGETTLPVALSFRLPEARKAGLISKPAVSNADTIEITARGAGMRDVSDRFSVSPGETVSRSLQIPIGSARVFSVTVFDAGGNAIYGGVSPPTDVAPGEVTRVTILLRPLRLGLPSELPRISENYRLLDVMGTPPFVKSATSASYAITVGIPALGDRYALPNPD